MTFPAQHISVSINRPLADVYAFASNPANLPKWATGLSDSLEKVGDEWIANSPMGKIKIAFAAQNKFGVLDHVVTLPSGEQFDNPMRVVANGEGSEVTFTLYRRPEMTDAMVREDAATIRKDLEKLKALLEA